jgi:hypothetical protein
MPAVAVVSPGALASACDSGPQTTPPVATHDTFGATHRCHGRPDGFAWPEETPSHLAVPGLLRVAQTDTSHCHSPATRHRGAAQDTFAIPRE